MTNVDVCSAHLNRRAGGVPFSKFHCVPAHREVNQRAISWHDSRGIDTVRNNSHNWKTLNLTAEIGLISRRILLGLVTAAGVLPVAITVVVTVAWLLAQMHDGAAAAVLDRVALALGILWVIDLILLVVALAIHAIGPPDAEG